MLAKSDVLRPIDATVRRDAKTILRTARYGALATAEPSIGVPMASRVSVASDSEGAPVFPISQLADHFDALEKNPRASVLLGEPGRGDPLAHPRITVAGRAHRVPDRDRNHIRQRFLARHPKAALYVDFGDFAFWRLEIEGGVFNGGFGKAYEMARDDLMAPTDQGFQKIEHGAVKHMNDDHADAVALYASAFAGRTSGNWKLACLDLEGFDLTSGDDVARVWFDPPLKSAEELRPRLIALAKQARSETVR